MKIVVLTSGMDSLFLLDKVRSEHRGAEVIPVWYDLGMKFSACERAHLPEFVESQDMSNYSRILDSYAIDGVDHFSFLYEGMILHALRTYHPDKIMMGVVATDLGYQDNTLEWVADFNAKMGRDVLSYPFLELGWGKKEILQWALNKGLSVGSAAAAHCCRSNLALVGGCGSCWSCLRKRGVFKSFGLETPIPSFLERPSKRVIEALIECKYNLSFGHGMTMEEDMLLAEYMPSLIEDLGLKDVGHLDIDAVVAALKVATEDKMDILAHELETFL
ncbi:MAG: 7-cyano-7-deazaguanine synthase [Vibrio splendidus]